MKQRAIRLLMAAGVSACISLAGTSPAAAAPAKVGVSTVKPFLAPVVTINALPNSTAATKTSKRLLRPSYKVGKGATLVSTRLSVRTAGGKVITPSATSVNVLPGSYRVTTTIRYTYKQNGKTVAKTVSKAQTLVIGVAKPAPAKSVDADVFDRLNALRVKKGLPAFKTNPAFEAFLTARAAGSSPLEPPTGLELSSGDIIGGSYIGIASIAVDQLLDHPSFRSKLYDPAYNTLSVATRTIKGKKEMYVYSARFSAPVAAPVTAVKPSVLKAGDVFSRLNALRVKKGLPAFKANRAFDIYVAGGGVGVSPLKELPAVMSMSGADSRLARASTAIAAFLDQPGFSFSSALYDPTYNTLSVFVSGVKGGNLITVGFGHISANK